ncbi:hypothetical protein [Novosphingobium sp. Fuku2-ISO-50]|uniref:hypothetical protein n=1 Tax=Novosphingobium sp. Fuku2-ISO-50 TaxID=1739114 RepID=UPI0012E34FCE|nr:hypothetical protein [Novosphingobium sp. Fuku2-ISO-50]
MGTPITPSTQQFLPRTLALIDHHCQHCEIKLKLEKTVSPPRELTDEEAADFALSMSRFERDVIILCSKGKSWRYPRIADKIGASYEDVQAVGHKLQAMRLARFIHESAALESSGLGVLVAA